MTMDPIDKQRKQDQVQIKERAFEYGPVTQGIFTGLISLTILVAVIAPKMLGYYILFLLFLGLGLRPFLAKTGTLKRYQHRQGVKQMQQNKTLGDIKRREIEQKEQSLRYRRSRIRDERLPKNW